MKPSLRFLITAGPTREPMDPVRYLSNRSSGKMGFAIAAAAAELGHEVELIAGPVNLATPMGKITRTNVTTAEEMANATASIQHRCEICIFCAAVADFKPAIFFDRKIKRKSKEKWTLELTPTRDILQEAVVRRSPSQTIVGFAAETDEVSGNAHSKLIAKDCDLIAANDVAANGIGFESDENALTLHFRSGAIVHIGQDTKARVARILLENILRFRDSS